MPNYARIELHLHLDGSLNLKWAYEKSLVRNVIPEAMSFREYYNLVYRDNTKPHSTSINKFDLMCDILQEKEDLYAAAYDLVRRLQESGIWYAEIRFASQQHTKHGLSQKEALQAVIEGTQTAMEDFPGIRIGVIDCMMHKGGSAAVNHRENLAAIEAVGAFLGKGAVGLDLAGYENNTDYKSYGDLFAKAKEKGIPCTAHAGEMGIGEHILDALSFGVKRIGHGVNCLQKQEYLDALIQTKIPLEVCVTSNVKRTMNYGEHAVLDLLSAGVNVTLNSDNMLFARTNAANEHFQLKMLGVSDETLRQCTVNAAHAAFCDNDTKNWLLEKIEQEG